MISESRAVICRNSRTITTSYWTCVASRSFGSRWTMRPARRRGGLAVLLIVLDYLEVNGYNHNEDDEYHECENCAKDDDEPTAVFGWFRRFLDDCASRLGLDIMTNEWARS